MTLFCTLVQLGSLAEVLIQHISYSPHIFVTNYVSNASVWLEIVSPLYVNVQAVPVPKHLADSIKDVFISISRQQGIDLQEVPPLTDLKQVLKAGIPYFWVELPTGERLLHRINGGGGFPLQLGRYLRARYGLTLVFSGR